MEDFETIDRLTSLNTITLADKNYDVKVDADIKADIGPVYVGRGLWDQMGEYHIFDFKPFTIVEMGDYSMLVKETYENYKVTDVKGIQVTEAINTSEGTILYFSDKLPEELKYYDVVYANIEKDWNIYSYDELIKSQIEKYKTSVYLPMDGSVIINK